MKSIPIGLLLLAVRLFAATQVQCLDSSSPDLPAIANVYTGFALDNDGDPIYIDQQKNAKVRIFQWGDLWAFNSTDKQATPIRSLKFNLGPPLGTIVDPRGEFHALYKLDPPACPTCPRQIHSIQEIPNGTTVDAGRVDMKVQINGVVHLILFGSGWPRGVCVDGSTVTPADDTTTARITRLGNQYDVWVPPPFHGRLYNNKNSNKPVDLGLIEFPFFVRLTLKP